MKFSAKEFLPKDRITQNAVINFDSPSKGVSTQEFYLISLIINNLIERAHLYSDYKLAHKKFIDLAAEHCHNWETLTSLEKDTLLEQGWVKFNGGSISIKKIRMYE